MTAAPAPAPAPAPRSSRPSSSSSSSTSSRTALDPEAQPLLLAEPAGERRRSASASSDKTYGTRTRIRAVAGTSRDVADTVLPETAVVGRNLGWTSAVMLIFSRMIGSGVFATPGTILLAAGSPGMSLVLWLVGAIVSFCSLAVVLEFGTTFPRSGGEKVYLEYVYRRPRFLASTVYAVQTILLGFTASNCIIFGQYMLYALGQEPTTWNQRGIAAGVIVSVTIVHGCSLKTGIWLNNALGFIKLLLMLFLILTGLFVLLGLGPPTTPTTPSAPSFSLPSLFAGTETSVTLLATGLFKVLYSFAGYSNANNVMNELRDPVRTLRSAAPTALVLVSASYLLINLAYFAVIPASEIKQSGQLVAALFFTKVFGDRVGRVVLPVCIALSALGNVFVVTYAHSRVNQEIARQGFVPLASLLASNKPFNAPLGGLILHLVPSLLVILLPPPGDVYAFILDVVGYPAQITSLFMTAGLLILRRREPGLKRPFRAWRGAVVVSLLSSAVLVAAPLVNDAGGRSDVSFWYGTYAVVGAGILVLAVAYWYVWTVAVPRWKGYRLEEEYDVLDDGTTITRLVKVYHD